MSRVIYMLRKAIASSLMLILSSKALSMIQLAISAWSWMT